MKDFILLIMAGITVFTLSLIAYSKWEKHVAYKAEYTELRQEIYRLDKGRWPLRSGQMSWTRRL